MYWLAAELPQDCVVEGAFNRNAFKNSFSHYYSQYFGSYLEKFFGKLVVVELVEGVITVTELHKSQLGIEYFFDAETHPLAQKSSSI